MSQKVCAGALLKCSCGAIPTSLVVTPEKKVLTGSPSATINDNKPNNIIPFGLCTAGPAPTPCSPITPLPWLPGSPTVLISNQPALTKNSKLVCMRGGVIEILFPGQVTVEVAG
jgi:hypothetical protein